MRSVAPGRCPIPARASAQDTALEYCLFAASLVQAVFCLSAVHPVRACDFGVYRPEFLMVDRDLFEDGSGHGLELVHGLQVWGTSAKGAPSELSVTNTSGCHAHEAHMHDTPVHRTDKLYLAFATHPNPSAYPPSKTNAIHSQGCL